MSKRKTTPDHIKEIRQIRKYLSKKYLQDPTAYLQEMSRKRKQWKMLEEKTRLKRG